MSVRQPTRLLDISKLTEAYPLELLADFETGNFTLKTSTGDTIEHKKPGTLTVKQGDSVLLNSKDLFENIELNIPEFPTSIAGNAETASKLATARTLTIGNSSKSFNGTANVSWSLSEIGAAAANHNHDDEYLGISATATAATKLATARTLTIGSASKSFNGTANVSWTLSEIGAAASSHTHSYLPLTGGTLTGALTANSTLTVKGKLQVNTAGNVSGISVKYSATITTTWSGTAAPYTQSITVTGMKATDIPVVDFVCSGTYATDKAREEAFGNIYRIVPAANKITLYAHAKTTTSCPIQLVVTR